MSRYLLDTNICVHYLKAEHDLEAKVLSAGLHNCFISELTIAEMLYGLAKCEPTYASQQRHHIGQLRRLFNSRVLSIADAFDLYGPEKAKLLDKVKRGELGKFPGEFDVLIGCTALAHTLTLVTRNVRDFAPLAGLMVEDWTSKTEDVISADDIGQSFPRHPQHLPLCRAIRYRTRLASTSAATVSGAPPRFLHCSPRHAAAGGSADLD